MAKFPTNPTLYDDCLQLTISFLKKYNYLKPQQVISGTCNWSSNRNPIGSISFVVNTHSEQPYIELDYKYRNEPRKYKVELLSVPSNIGKGVVWYFICPHTKKRCRKLFSVGGYFFHREAFRGCMYKIQTESKRNRAVTRKYKALYKGNEYDQLQAAYFKMYYNGKPTKRFLRIMKVIKQAEALPDPFFDKLKY